MDLQPQATSAVISLLISGVSPAPSFLFVLTKCTFPSRKYPYHPTPVFLAAQFLSPRSVTLLPGTAFLPQPPLVCGRTFRGGEGDAGWDFHWRRVHGAKGKLVLHQQLADE